MSIIVLGLFTTLQAQNNLTEYHYSAYGFQKAIKEANYISYTFEDKYVEESAKESFMFNDEGYIVENIFSLVGAYKSDAITTYTYKDGRVESKSIVVIQYPNFNTETTYTYDKDGKLIYIITEGVYGNELKNFYNKKNQLETQLGVYTGSNTMENYFYNNNELFKTVKTYYKEDSITQIDQFLYKNGKIIVSNTGDYADVYLKNTSREKTIRINSSGDSLAKDFSDIEKYLIKNKVNEDFNLYIASFPNVELMSETVFKYNSNKDWISCKQENNEIFKNTFYKFQEIKYLDGTISGSTEFNFFDVNELKNK